ncbi:elongation factor G [Dictyocaulus viviparus]|uniref:Elongation factor G n=1 Tax=Dictyocaulus viviparus TaxID=29172 RepID=A0A0D8XJ21_DICVI|nr:elongation factor G [Dictyocaulus viviparus]
MLGVSRITQVKQGLRSSDLRQRSKMRYTAIHTCEFDATLGIIETICELAYYGIKYSEVYWHSSQDWVQVNLSPESSDLRAEWLKAINEGCRNALQNGPVLGFPIHDVVITLKAITYSGRRVNSTLISACAHKCVTEAVQSAKARLIEPLMQVEITLESGVEAQAILHELTCRRANIITGTTYICSYLPVSEMTGFPTILRTLSSGLASLSVQIAGNVMDDLAFLIKGYGGITDFRSKFKWLCYMIDVCNNQPIRLDGEETSADFLHANFLIRLHHIGKEDFMDEANDVLCRYNSLRDFNRELYYFVLVATYRLSDRRLYQSLENFATEKLRYLSDWSVVCNDDPHKFFHLPRLPWDISSVLNNNLVVIDNVNEIDSIEPGIICPFDSRGVLTSMYSELLSNDTLRCADRKVAGPFVFIHFNHKTSRSALLDMFNGISSDIFQEELSSRGQVKEQNYCT